MCSYKYIANAGFCPGRLPLVPRNSQFALEDEEERAPPGAPTPSTMTSSTTMASDKLKLRRGQHGRHKKHDDVHMIAQVGLQGEPL